jgi:hypothetical protein
MFVLSVVRSGRSSVELKIAAIAVTIANRCVYVVPESVDLFALKTGRLGTESADLKLAARFAKRCAQVVCHGEVLQKRRPPIRL